MASMELAVQVQTAMDHQKKKFGKEPIATPGEFIQILGEEFGEVCRGINQDDLGKARHEVIQCIAVCFAWLEGDLHFGRQP